MNDDILPPDPNSKAREFAVAVMNKHADTYFERIEVGNLDGLLNGERVFVEFRRVRPDNISWALPLEVEAVA